MDRETIQRYVTSFRRWIVPSLRPGIGMRCTIHNAQTGGAIVEFSFAANSPGGDDYRPEVATLNDALRNVPQNAFGGNLDGFTFSGTNTILENGRIVLIKDDTLSEWTEHAATRDIQRVLNPRKQSRS